MNSNGSAVDFFMQCKGAKWVTRLKAVKSFNKQIEILNGNSHFDSNQNIKVCENFFTDSTKWRWSQNISRVNLSLKPILKVTSQDHKSFCSPKLVLANFLESNCGVSLSQWTYWKFKYEIEFEIVNDSCSYCQFKNLETIF